MLDALEAESEFSEDTKLQMDKEMYESENSLRRDSYEPNYNDRNTRAASKTLNAKPSMIERHSSRENELSLG